MFISVVFIIAKIWKQSKCFSVEEWIKKAVVHLYNGILLGHRKEGNIILWDRMDGPGEQYVSEISQPEKGK